MPYQITLTNNTVLTNLADNTVDNTTSLTLVGRNYPGYGGPIANNFVRLLENAANTEPPNNPLVGQLWYDTTPDSAGNLYMKVWTGATWFALTAGVSSVLGNTGTITLQNLVSGGVAPLQSPSFSGVPTGPTPAQGTNSNQLATTAYVINQVGTLVGGVSSVVGNTGAVTLGNLVNAGLAPLGSPTFTGTPTAPTPQVGANNNQIATTAYVINEVGSLSTGCSSVLGNSGNVSLAQMVTAGLAPIKAPQFQGIPTAPTAATGTNTNQIATCAFVQASIPTVTAITGSAGSSGAAGSPGTAGATGPTGPAGVSVPVRTLLSGDITLYVSPAGNDTTGAGTQASPYATMQHAYNVLLSSYDGGGFNCTIALMNGTHTSGCQMNSPLIGFPNGVQFHGVGSAQGAPGQANTSAAVVVAVSNANCFDAQMCEFSVSGFTLGGATGTNTNLQQTGNLLSVGYGALCVIGTGMIFGSCGSYHILVQSGAVTTLAAYSITGGAGAGHVVVAECGIFIHNGSVNNAVVSILNNPAIPIFMQAINQSIAQSTGVTYSGTCTGAKFALGYNSLISCAGAGINYFPGTIAGTAQPTISGYYA